jgi:hypothetical protein
MDGLYVEPNLGRRSIKFTLVVKQGLSPILANS